MNQVPALAIAIADALKEHPELPYMGLHVWHDMTASITVDYGHGSEFSTVRKVAEWAREFGSGVIISLSHYGSGDAETTVELGGQQVAVKTGIGTAQAYELGRILQRELNRDVSIHIGADELLAAIDQVVA